MPETTVVTAWSMSVTADKAQIKQEEDERLAFAAERNQSFLFLLTDWAENTSWGGVPYIVKKKNYFFKLIWLGLVLGGLGVTLYQTWEVFDGYFKYPVNINVNITHTNKLIFPAVTVCNVNVMRLSQIPNIPAQYLGLFTTFFGNGTTQSVTNAQRQQTKELFEQVYNSMDPLTRYSVAHQRHDMVLDCTFNGHTCDNKYFIDWTDTQYGNCFTFNSGWIVHNTTSWYNIDALQTYRTGPNYGLSMELYVEEEEYIQEITDVAGFKLIVANQGAPPFPGDGGIYLTPATFSSVTIQKANITRLPSPYPSGCITLSDRNEAMKLDAYVEAYQLNYDITSCFKSCYQSYVLLECGCGDPKIPINAVATRTKVSNQSQTFQACNTVELCMFGCIVECQHNISTKFSENLLDCEQCKVACEDIVFYHSLSTARWPNEKFKQTKLDQVSANHTGFAAYMANSTTPEQNILKFNVHFEELNYEVIYESASKPFSGIYGDIGGVIGLWLGLSFIAVFELVQLAMDTVGLACVKFSLMMGKKKTVSDNHVKRF